MSENECIPQHKFCWYTFSINPQIQCKVSYRRMHWLRGHCTQAFLCARKHSAVSWRQSGAVCPPWSSWSLSESLNRSTERLCRTSVSTPHLGAQIKHCDYKPVTKPHKSTHVWLSPVPCLTWASLISKVAWKYMPPCIIRSLEIIFRHHIKCSDSLSNKKKRKRNSTRFY